MSYKNDLQQFQKFFNLNEIENLEEDKIKNYVKFLAKNYSTASHCRKLSSLKIFYFFRGKKLLNITFSIQLNFQSLKERYQRSYQRTK